MRVLVVDDEPGVQFAVMETLEAAGREMIAASTAAEALDLVARDHVDVVVSDFSMPEMDGLQLLERIRAIDSTLPVILITAHGSERLAVRALKQGAYDYLAKPFDNDELVYSVERAAESRRLRLDERGRSVESAVGVRIIGRSPAVTRLLDAAAKVANKDVTVLVRGETGTGKELVASFLHLNSTRSAKPLVVFNCAAIPPELAEAQLFGHVRGAFTGAVNNHEGYFAQADGGTLFLDEIGELRLDVQAKLLRALQEREIQPIGGSHVDKVDVRVIAATHRDLAAEVKAGRFREDLYYRLNVVELVVPPLRDRKVDIALLAREFARKYSERFGLNYVVQLAPELLENLEHGAWPGNIRQLENTIARAIALSGTTKIIGLDALEPTAEAGQPAPHGPSFREQVEAFERNLLRHALAASHGNQSETARRLQLNRASLYDKLKKYGMTHQ
ncbi:MAG: sigma-54 dependent transcriptional regulator [Kofleriaceae bacterium]